MQMKLAILVKYIGTAFDGFQAQPSNNTVQQYLTSAVSKAVGIPCNVTGCSRTDSGVHANGFVASISPERSEDMEDDWCGIPPERFHRAVVRYLPPDIAVVGCAKVDDSFHPRYDSKGKEYVYLMKDSPEADPFLRGRAWQLRRRITDAELDGMREICGLFVGRHDFRAFMSSGSSVTDTVREVKYANVERCDGILRFTVSADGFLYNMVRIMTGTLADAALGKMPRIAEALETGERTMLGSTAPPEGLYLNRVFYDVPIDFRCE